MDDNMVMPKIEDGIPIPPRNSYPRPLKPISAAAEKLQPGQSFYAESRNKNLGSALYFIRRKYPDRVYITRREGDGVRVWRQS